MNAVNKFAFNSHIDGYNELSAEERAQLIIRSPKVIGKIRVDDFGRNEIISVLKWHPDLAAMLPVEKLTADDCTYLQRYGYFGGTYENDNGVHGEPFGGQVNHSASSINN